MNRLTCSIALAAALLAGSCATEPDPLDRTQPEAVPKAIFDGTWYYNLTVTDADWENRYTFIGEETRTYLGKAFKVRWEVTQDRLNAYMVPQVYRDSAGKPIVNKVGQKSLVLSFRIKKHYDIRYRYNATTREELNVIEENTDRPWDQREYMELDWTRNLATNIWNPTAQDVAVGKLIREDVAVKENVEFFSRGATPEQDQVINTRSWDKDSDPEVYAINIDTKESLTTKLSNWMQLYYGYHMDPTTVRFRHSLLKATPLAKQTYKPLDYRDEVFRRFGFFRTEYEVYDPDRHVPVESKKKYFINRWDLSGKKQIVWYLSPATQEAVNGGDKDLKVWAQEVCDAYNKTFQEATGRTDKIVVLKENAPLIDEKGEQVTLDDGTKRWKYELGDLRFSFINITFKQGLGQPGGYGPSTPEPDTGEILRANVNIYGGWMEWVVQRALDQYDVAAGLCTLDDVMNGRHYSKQSGKCDGGDTSAQSSGPSVSGVGASTSVAGVVNGGGAKQAASARFLSPALISSYLPQATMSAAQRKELLSQLKLAQPQLKALHKWEVTHPTTINLNGFATVKGSKHESALLPQGNLHALLPFAPGASDPDVISQLSPASRLSPASMKAFKESMTRELAVRDEPTMFEPAIHAFVQEMKDQPRKQVEARLRKWVFYTTILHEMGHTLGLRHNFAASADRRNFPPEFEKAYAKHWDQIDTLRKTYQAKIKNGDAGASAEYAQKINSLAATHQRYASSSIMDYTGDWMDWTKPVRSYDRAALLLGYANKVEVHNAKRNTWELATYKSGDFDQKDPLSATEKAKSGRKVRYYLFCTDDRVFDDAFCTPFDRGVTATEIVRNFIQDSQTNYLFRNFKRDRTSFDGQRRGYYMYKWLRQYYMYAKPFAQLTLNSLRYDEFWPSIFNGINSMVLGPETRNLKPGYSRDGGEDLLRASLLYYYYLIYDVLMRPDYGHFQLTHDTSGAPYWSHTKEQHLEQGKPDLFIPAGVGWGFTDVHDLQYDSQIYETKLKRIGVEMDKLIALEVLSIPMALNTPLTYEKANGNSFWSSLWTNNGVQLWSIVRGMIAGNFAHLQNPWCIKCDAKCQAEPKKNPPQLRAHPVDYLEGLGSSGIFSKYPLPTGKTRCGVDEQPVEPALDDLFAIKPMFYAISGASHPWYHNSLSEKLDSQVKGGNHRFDIPTGATSAEFTNANGTKTYQAVQTEDGLSVSYALVDNGRKISNRIALVDACLAGKDTTALEGAVGTYKRTCTEVKACYSNSSSGSRPTWCDKEGWSSSFTLNAVKYRDLDRIEAMLIMMMDMIDLAGHYAWRVPGYLSGD